METDRTAHHCAKHFVLAEQFFEQDDVKRGMENYLAGSELLPRVNGAQAFLQLTAAQIVLLQTHVLPKLFEV